MAQFGPPNKMGPPMLQHSMQPTPQNRPNYQSSFEPQFTPSAGQTFPQTNSYNSVQQASSLQQYLPPAQNSNQAPPPQYAVNNSYQANQFQTPQAGYSAPVPPGSAYVHNQQPQQESYAPYANNQMDQLASKLSTVNHGWNQAWQNPASVNLMAEKEIKTQAVAESISKRSSSRETSTVKDLNNETVDSDIMRSTLNKIPHTASLLQKCRLPLGVVLHPFKDVQEMPVIQDSPIVRCRSCRTYINPFVRLMDQRRWQCNMCHRINEVPDEFVYDFQRRRHIDMSTRPELIHSSIEYVASVEYMVRPPQPATYLFVFECTGPPIKRLYIKRFAETLCSALDSIPGDSRTLIGFIAFDSRLHFFNLNQDKPVHLIEPDIDDVFIPHADCILVNLKDRRQQIVQFLSHFLPSMLAEDDRIGQNQAALVPALQIAYKIMSPSGGRITVIQTSLPTLGVPLKNREDPNNRTVRSDASTSSLTPLLNPASDYFKTLALECCEHQVAVDLFNLSPDFSDLATIGSVAKFSSGSIYYYGGGGTPQTERSIRSMLERFQLDMYHYLTRTIGFEAVMRVRCTKGVSVHTFHGNLFVRSTDLVALPNVNPDSSFGIQMTITDDLKDYSSVCVQAALLFTSSRGERRIRVHTISLPIVTIISDVLASADHEVIVSLLAKMAVERSVSSNLQDAREALINANVDIINTYRLSSAAGGSIYSGLFTAHSLRLLPIYSLALLKHTAFRLGISTRIDERFYAMQQMKTLPLKYLMVYIYPNLYALHRPYDLSTSPPLPLHLSFANIDRNGVYLLDAYDHIVLYICKSVHPQWLEDVCNVTQWSAIPDINDVEGFSPLMDKALFPVTPEGDHRSSNETNGQPQTRNGRSSLLSHQLNELLLDQLDLGNDEDENGEDTDHWKNYNKLNPLYYPLSVYDNEASKNLYVFVQSLMKNRPIVPKIHVLREDSRSRYLFLQYMYDDRNESAFSYYEFLQHLQEQLDK